MFTITCVVCFTLSVFAVLLIAVLRPRPIGRLNALRGGRKTKRGHATVILCVRGADPSLRKCLDGLLEQEYENYTVQVVLDAESDPAREVIQAFAQRSSRLRMEVLRNPPPNRGLKVSAILQGLRSLSAQTEFVAFIDADAIPHRTWLSELLAPLDDPLVGVTTGTRWFRPQLNNLGSIIRAEWNLYAVAIMRYFGIPWGGSFALRKKDIERCGVTERWQTTICEDTCLGDVVRAQGLRVEVVPSLSIMNDETCTLAGALSFITRQLFFGRLHSRARIPILIFSTGMPACSIVSLMAALTALWLADYTSCFMALAALLLYYASVVWFEFSWTRWLSGARPEMDTNTVSWFKLCYLPLLQFCCAMVATTASVAACVTRRITWRGITYRVTAPNTVQMDRYRPYTAHRAAPEAQSQIALPAKASLQESLSI